MARKAKLIFLIIPNNPTGAVANLEYFKKVVEFAEKYDILICHDQAYCEMTYDGYVATSFFEITGAKERCIEFFSHSKTYIYDWLEDRLGSRWRKCNEAVSTIKNNIDSEPLKLYKMRVLLR